MLGPSPPSKRPHDVPVEMAVFREKLRPGSGVLAVKVITDGPTRVLQVTDINQQVICFSIILTSYKSVFMFKYKVKNGPAATVFFQNFTTIMRL